jgi:ABC-type uncharacterized transport system involved in gliding motility auxiliary subunit
MPDQKKRRTVTFTQAIIYSVIMIAILATINFLSNRYDKSYDATSNKKFTLSDQSAKIAKSLKQNVVISYWDRSERFKNARDLFDRYKNLSPKIDVQYYDPDKKVTQARAAGVKNYGTIFVQVGNKKEEAKSLTEEDVTGAMVRALKGGDREVCFTAGYGEGSTEDTSGPDGFGAAKSLTEKGNYKTQTIKLIPKAEIPKECTIVVVAGPKRDYLQTAVEALKAYVEKGGRALFMLDPPLKLARQEIDENAALVGVLQGWGVTLQKDLVKDPGSMTEYGPLAPAVTSYGDQAIVREMKQEQAFTLMPLVRSLELKDTDRTKVESLFSTSSAGSASTNLANADAAESKSDLKGPLVMGAAGTYTTGSEDGNGRFVVVGSSSFAGNRFLGALDNRDLYLNMLDWLSSDEDLISIRPKEPSNNPLNMNARQVSMLFYESVVGLPLLIVVAGVGVWWRRR